MPHCRVGTDARCSDYEYPVAPEPLHHAGPDDTDTRLTSGHARAVADAIRCRRTRCGVAHRGVVWVARSSDGEPVEPQCDVWGTELKARHSRRGARHVAYELTVLGDDFR